MGVLTYSEFQGHSARGQKKNYLAGWKSKDPYSTRVWLHPKASILAVWRHPFALQKRDTKDGRPTVDIWSNKLVCWEDEELLQEQNYFDKQTRARENPPVICPHCLMVDWMRNQILAGRLNWTTPIFRFEHDDPNKVLWLHAGGLCGMFDEKDLPVDKKKELALIPRESGGPVYLRGNAPNVAFKQNQKAKLEYVFTVVDADNPGKGILITNEAQLLGQKVQAVIAHTKKSLGATKGDIQIHPYAMEWIFDPADGIAWDKKYDALRMESIRMTPKVEELLRTPPPSIEEIGQRFNPKTHLANLERQLMVKIPLEQFFEKAIKVFEAGGGRAKSATPASAPAEDNRGDAYEPAPFNEVPAPAKPDPDTLVKCDNPACAKPIKISLSVCPHCGQKYDNDADPLPLPPPLPTRAQAMAASRGVPLPPVQQEENGGSSEDDDIPF